MTTPSATTTYAFLRPTRDGAQVVFTSRDPVAVWQAWRTAEFRELPLRVLRDGKVNTPPRPKRRPCSTPSNPTTKPTEAPRENQR